MLDVDTMVDLILYQNRSPRFVVELEEDLSVTRWTRLGRNLDEIIKYGGFLTQAATQIFSLWSTIKGMESESARFEPYMLKYAKEGGKDILSADTPENKQEMQRIADKFKGARDAQHVWMTRTMGAQVAQAGLTVLGALGLFQTIGRSIDRKRFIKGLHEGLQNLLVDALPEHKQMLLKAIRPLMSVDPFSDVMEFTSKLRELIMLMEQFNNPRYERHIVSAKKFLS